MRFNAKVALDEIAPLVLPELSEVHVGYDSTKFSIAIVSTDTSVLREIAWTLSAHGYQGTPSSDWSEQAAWRRTFAPSLLILDARDDQQAQAVLAAPRSAPYTYRIALYDSDMLSNPDALLDLGADDLIHSPLNVGELIASLRRGARRLEFERRLSLNATFDQHRGVASRRGFTLQLDRKFGENGDTSSGALVVVAIDSLETIRQQYGAAAVENACSVAAEMVYGSVAAQDCRGIVDEGVFAVHLHGKSPSEGVQFAREVNERCAVMIGRGTSISISGVVLGWPSTESAEVAIYRAITALDLLSGWGGGQILEVEEVEREHSAWKAKFKSQRITDARHAMEALPLVWPSNIPLVAGPLGVPCVADGPMPPCIPVVDDVGHLVGVVDRAKLQAEGKESIDPLDEHLEHVSAILRGDSRLDEIVASLDAADTDYLLVVENKKPIGYVTRETVGALRTGTTFDSSADSFAAADYGLSSLVVPLV